MADDDEISIDFSKIKGKIGALFKKKDTAKEEHSEKSEHKHVHEEEESEHKNHHEHKEHHETKVSEAEPKEENEGSISLDSEKIFSFFKKYWHFIGLLCIVIFVIYMRMQVMNAPVTEDWAYGTIVNYYRNQFSAQINAQNPNLPDANKQALTTKQLDAFLKENKDTLAAQTKNLAEEYKNAISYEYNGKKYIYLGDIDSYYWLRYARNILEHGSICDEFRNGVCYEALALAPIGRPDIANMHPYMIAATYKTAKLLGMEIPLMQAGLITPTIIAIFTAIAAFFLGYLLMGKIAGLIISLLMSTNTMYVQRSIGSDNDGYTLLFPLIIICFLILAINAKNRKNMCIYSAIAGFMIGVYKFSWEHGWWNTFDAIIFSFIIYIGFLFVHDYYIHKNIVHALKNKILKDTALIMVLFYVGGFIGYFIFNYIILDSNIRSYFVAPLEPLGFFKFAKAAVNLNMWPNVLTTVAEFNPISLSAIPNQLFAMNFTRTLLFLAFFGIIMLVAGTIYRKGNRMLLLIAAAAISFFFSLNSVMSGMAPLTYVMLFTIMSLGFLLVLIYKKETLDINKQHHLLIGIILIIWFVGTIFAATRGVRFVLLVVAPVSIAIGYALEIIYEKITLFFSENYSGKSMMVIKTIAILIVLIIPLSTIKGSMTVTSQFIPNYNAAWDDALLKIRDDSQKNAIVNSWWDFGHWFKYTTERGVTLDGAMQNSPQLHWLGKLLLTDNETVSKGILRMIDCKGNQAFDVVVNTTKDIPVAVDIINKIIVMEDHDKIKELLSSYGIPEKDQEKILQYSHCDAPENYLITSDDMVGKGGVWAHFGSWEFYKAEIAAMKLGGMSKEQIVKNLTTREFRNSSKSDVEKIYNEFARLPTHDHINAWIAPWPSFLGEGDCVKGENGTYKCSSGLILDINEGECYTERPNGREHPMKCSYIDQKNNFVMKRYNESIINVQGRNIGAMFYPNGESMHVVMMEPELVGSMFARLFYMQGHGLKYFDLFTETHSPLGADIYVWKVDWNGESVNKVYGTATPAAS